MRARTCAGALVLALLGAPAAASAASTENSNGCRDTSDDPCVRTGSCEIQGSAWDQVVTIDRADTYDTQGWPGLCDMVHVGLVQGDCEPPGARAGVTVYLSQTSSAYVPSIVGPLVCAGEPEPPSVPAAGMLLRALLGASLVAVGLRRSRSRAVRAPR